MSSPKATAPAARARSKAVAAAVDNCSCLEALMDTVGAAVREHGDDQTKWRWNLVGKFRSSRTGS